MPHYINYRISFKEYFVLINGLWFHFVNSLILNTNLFTIAINILDSYFYYGTLFEIINAKYIINHQHYHTDAIKNYLFKRKGGNYSCIIQKNIHQQGHNGFYYDADVLFTFGNKTSDRAYKFGARIGEVVSVGSFLMEHNWFNNIRISKNKTK